MLGFLWGGVEIDCAALLSVCRLKSSTLFSLVKRDYERWAKGELQGEVPIFD